MKLNKKFYDAKTCKRTQHKLTNLDVQKTVC